MAVFTMDEINKFKNFVANRTLSDKESLKYDKFTPRNWFTKQPIVSSEETPPKSGFGYTQSPYSSQWFKMWGVSPIVDMPKYRMMYRTVPIIKKAVDKTVATAISKGFSLDLPHNTERREEILTFLQEWIASQENFKLILQQLTSDALIYGTAYAEIVYDEVDTELKTSNDPVFTQRVEIADPMENYKMGQDNVPLPQTVSMSGDGRYYDVKACGKPCWIKPLDPLWMRVRRDSYGNVFGYLQYLSTPPVAFTNEKMLCIKFNAKSWWTENSYGTSFLLSLIRTQEAIWTIENDLILISHACAKPPLIFSCGNDENEPWTEGQLSEFVGSTSARGAGGDIYHRGDVRATPLPFPASSLAPLLAHLEYHKEQRIVALGVPPDLLGIHGGSNRSTATVSFDDWINTIQMLQQQIGDAIQEQLFKLIIQKKFGENVAIPSIVWNQIYEKDDQTEVQKIMTLRASNIITTNEARAWLSEIGKKLEPVKNGDSLLPPAAFMPTEKDEDNESIIQNSANLKAEYTIVEKKKPYIYMEKQNEKADEFVESSPSSDIPNQLMYPLLKTNKNKKFLSDEDIIPDVKIKKFHEEDGVEFWLVSGDKVFDQVDKQWKNTKYDTEHDYIGGHHFVFDYIPENEIWVSDQDKEIKKTSIHEFVERNLMKNKNYTYADAHIEALKAEGNKTEAEIKERSYITPEEVQKKLNNIYPKKEKENTWDLNNKILIYDEKIGTLSLKENENEIDKVLIRDYKDIDNFIIKYKMDKVESDIQNLQASIDKVTNTEKILSDKKIELMTVMVNKFNKKE